MMAKSKASCSPSENDCEISAGKNSRPVRCAARALLRCCGDGPSSSCIGLYPRNDANRRPTGGSCEMRWASWGDTPWATDPCCIVPGSDAARPATG